MFAIASSDSKHGDLWVVKKDSTSKLRSSPQDHRNVLMQFKLSEELGLNSFLNVDWFCSYNLNYNTYIIFWFQMEWGFIWWTRTPLHSGASLFLDSAMFKENQLHKRTGLKFANNPFYWRRLVCICSGRQWSIISMPAIWKQTINRKLTAGWVLYCFYNQWPFQEPKLEVPTIYKVYVRPM